jgi:hypothetical protein
MNKRFILFGLIFIFSIAVISYKFSYALFSSSASNNGNVISASTAFPTPPPVDCTSVFFAANQTVTSHSVTNPDRGWISDNSRATFDHNDSTADYGFPDLGIPSGATISGIEVTIEGQTTGKNLTAALWNMSNSSPAYTSAQIATLSTTDNVVTLGSPTDKWGKTWTIADFADANFKVRVAATTSGGGNALLDQVQVKVYCTLGPAPQADLTATKTNSVSGNAIINIPFNWIIRVENIGLSNATFNSGNTILTDNLPSSNVGYGAVTVTRSDASVTGNISCSITSSILSCTATGGNVVIPIGKYFDVSIPTTFSTTGPKVNPITTDGCKVDPSSTNGVISESNETNNTCSDTVTVIPIPLITTKSGSIFVDDPLIGSQTWSNPGYVITSDNNRASANMNTANIISHYLKTTGFGFDIPTGRTILGIVAEVERSESGTTLRVSDNSVKLVKGGVISGDDKSTGIDWPSADEYITYGGSSDLWGQTWTPADINASNFGFVISAKKDSSTNSRSAQINYIRITVYYTAP